MIIFYLSSSLPITSQHSFRDTPSSHNQFIRHLVNYTFTAYFTSPLPSISPHQRLPFPVKFSADVWFQRRFLPSGYPKLRWRYLRLPSHFICQPFLLDTWSLILSSVSHQFIRHFVKFLTISHRSSFTLSSSTLRHFKVDEQISRSL